MASDATGRGSNGRSRYEPDRGRTPPGRGDRLAARRGRVGGHAGRAGATSASRSWASSSPTRCSTRSRSIVFAGATAPSSRSPSALEGDRLVEVEIEPTTPALAERLADEAHRARRRPDGGDLPRARRLDRRCGARAWRSGLLLLIDYGAVATELYDPVRRRDGTLRAYVRHRVHDDPYRHVGRQDLTAHVDVTAVERAAAVAGLDAPRHATQAEFLVGAGTDELLRAIQVGPRDVAGGVPRGPLGADAPAGSGRDGSVPGHGVRARLARRSAAGRIRLSPAGTTAPLLVGNAGGSRRRRPHRTRAMYLLPPVRRRRARFAIGRARPDGERRANLHARSARAAPRRVLHGHQGPSAGPRRHLARPPPAGRFHTASTGRMTWAPVRLLWVRLPARLGVLHQRRRPPRHVARREFD